MNNDSLIFFFFFNGDTWYFDILMNGCCHDASSETRDGENWIRFRKTYFRDKGFPLERTICFLFNSKTNTGVSLFMR